MECIILNNKGATKRLALFGKKRVNKMKRLPGMLTDNVFSYLNKNVIMIISSKYFEKLICFNNNTLQNLNHIRLDNSSKQIKFIKQLLCIGLKYGRYSILRKIHMNSKTTKWFLCYTELFKLLLFSIENRHLKSFEHFLPEIMMFKNLNHIDLKNYYFSKFYKYPLLWEIGRIVIKSERLQFLESILSWGDKLPKCLLTRFIAYAGDKSSLKMIVDKCLETHGLCNMCQCEHTALNTSHGCSCVFDCVCGYFYDSYYGEHGFYTRKEPCIFENIFRTTDADNIIYRYSYGINVKKRAIQYICIEDIDYSHHDDDYKVMDTAEKYSNMAFDVLRPYLNEKCAKHCIKFAFIQGNRYILCQILDYFKTIYFEIDIEFVINCLSHYYIFFHIRYINTTITKLTRLYRSQIECLKLLLEQITEWYDYENFFEFVCDNELHMFFKLLGREISSELETKLYIKYLQKGKYDVAKNLRLVFNIIYYKFDAEIFENITDNNCTGLYLYGCIDIVLTRDIVETKLHSRCINIFEYKKYFDFDSTVLNDIIFKVFDRKSYEIGDIIPHYTPVKNDNRILLLMIRHNNYYTIRSCMKYQDIRADDSLALRLAVKNGDCDIVKLLLPYSMVSANNYEVLRYCISNNSLETLKLIMPYCVQSQYGDLNDLSFAIDYENEKKWIGMDMIHYLCQFDEVGSTIRYHMYRKLTYHLSDKYYFQISQKTIDLVPNELIPKFNLVELNYEPINFAMGFSRFEDVKIMINMIPDNRVKKMFKRRLKMITSKYHCCCLFF